jgi:hypothetical protein
MKKFSKIVQSKLVFKESPMQYLYLIQENI